jgi:hypothetical protein
MVSLSLLVGEVPQTPRPTLRERSILRAPAKRLGRHQQVVVTVLPLDQGQVLMDEVQELENDMLLHRA